MTYGIVSSIIYDKQDEFNLKSLISHFFVEIFLAPIPISMVYLFLRLLVCESIFLWLQQNKTIFDCLVTKNGYRYNKYRKAFSKFYHRHSELIVKHNVVFQTLLQQVISGPVLIPLWKFETFRGSLLRHK